MGGKNIDLAFCSNEFSFVSWLDDLHLLPLIQIQDQFYVKLVKEFYMKFRIVSSPHEEFALSSTVKGQRIFLDVRILASILHIPHTGIYIFEYKKWPEVEGFHPSHILSILYPNDPNIHPNMALCTNKLYVDHRLLHHLIVHQLLPTSGGYAKLSRMEAFLMWYIISKVEFCYPLLMLHTMVRAFTQKKSVLPFGCILTKIFRHLQVSLEGEIGTKLKKEDTYNKSTLNRMGWKKQGGIWTYCPKADQGQRIEREEQEEIPPWGAQEEPQPAQVQGSSSTSDYDRMIEFMSARFDALNSRFDSMEASIESKFGQVNSRIDNLEKDHLTIRSDFESVDDTIYYDLKVTKRRLKRMERKLAASKVIDTCEETSGMTPPPIPILLPHNLCCYFFFVFLVVMKMFMYF
ncbi:hypothetical protein CFOL_v3_23289 [Cephalotus follicularis]|uniref:Putative plant transposon protein domain-containing protein n=1 Tax=Cephalotus follicularis TaxID=3775 RepID=A0A1Q3CHV4_CEPFO|nr:hypothetical protein CFOL_v3_23289 [Cephalotus follicularis]